MAKEDNEDKPLSALLQSVIDEVEKMREEDKQFFKDQLKSLGKVPPLQVPPGETIH